jgi:hypothetical protein
LASVPDTSGSEGHIKRPARRAILTWFAGRDVWPQHILAQLMEDMCVSDIPDLREYIGYRYGKDADLPIAAAMTDASHQETHRTRDEWLEKRDQLHAEAVRPGDAPTPRGLAET